MLKADYSRFVVDLNRCAKDGPCNENGVIKLKDFHLQSFYPSSFTLSQAERDRRIELYYKPFHAQMLANLHPLAIRPLIQNSSLSFLKLPFLRTLPEDGSAIVSHPSIDRGRHGYPQPV
jgi:hypothetical protein